MQSLTPSRVIGRSASARKAPAPTSLREDVGSLSAGGAGTSAARERAGSVVRSASARAASLTRSGKAEGRAAVGREARGFCRSPSRDSGSVGRCSPQPFGHNVGQPQVCPRSTVTLCSPNQHLPPAPHESLGGAPTTAAPPTSTDDRTSALPGTREAPKRSKIHIRSTHVHSAPGGPSGAMRPVSARDTPAPPQQRRQVAKSAEVATEPTPTPIPSAVATTTSSPLTHTHTTSCGLFIPRSRTARTSASLEAFLLSFQNCLHRQEILFQRVDTAVAQLESARVDAGGATVSPPSSAPTTRAPTASLRGSASLPRYVLPSHISSYASVAAATGASPTRLNRTVTFPGAVAGARRRGGANDMASSNAHTDGAPVVSASSSQQELPLTEGFHRAQGHQPSQSTGSSTLSLSVVVVQPALKRVGGNDVASPMMCSSSQGLLSPPQQMSPLLTLPTYVRVDGVGLTPTLAAPSRLSHSHTLFPSSTPKTPPSPARLAMTQKQLLTSNNGCTGSLPLNTRVTSRVTDSPSIARSGGVLGRQGYPAGDAEVVAGEPAMEAPVLPASAEWTDACEAATGCSRASTAAENTAAEDAGGGAGGRQKGAGATESSSNESASASPILHSAQMPYLTTTISGADQSFNSGCGGAGSDGVPAWSSALPGHAKGGSLRIGGIPESSVMSAFSESADSVSLSPLSRPPSIWIGSPRTRGTLGPTSPHQAPPSLQLHSSLGGSTISTAWISPRRVPNSHNSRSSSNAAGAAQASANRSPRAAAALENPRHTSTAVNSAGSLPSTSQQQPQQRSSGDLLSPLSGQWLLSPSPTPTVSRRASGVAHRGSVQLTSVNLSGSGTQNIAGNSSSGNAGGLVTVMSSATVEGNVVSSLSSTSPLVPPCFPDSGDVATGADQAVTSPVTTCRQLTLSSSPSAEEADRDDSPQEISLRPPIGLAEEADDEDAQQLEQLANRYVLPPPPPSLTELQQQQNQRRRWSAPPVPTMRRPPMAPLRHPNATCPGALQSEEERLRSSTPPVARPEEWLSFEQQHERLHLPECWRDSEVIVVDHVTKDRERDSEEAERLLELEEELLRELRQNQSAWADGDGLLRRGRRRGSWDRHLTAGANAAGETIDEEELDWGDDSADEAAADAAYEARLARYGRAMLLHRRGRSHASLYRDGGEGCSCGSCPSATGWCCRRRPANGGDREGFPCDDTASLRGAPSGERTTLPAATGVPAGSPVLPTHNFSRRHSAPATIWGADKGTEWRDLQARFEELISIQQRSRGSERDGADDTTLDEQSLSTLANNTASSPMKGGLASGISRRRRTHSFSHEVAPCPADAAGRRPQSPSPPGSDLSSSYRDHMPHCGDGSSGLPAPSPRTGGAAAPTALERTHTHPGPSGYRRVQWRREAKADAGPSLPSQAPENQRIASGTLSPYSSTPPSPSEGEGTSGQSNHGRVSAACTNPPAFLMSPRHPSKMVSAPHTASTRGSAETREETDAYNSDVGEEEKGSKSAMAARTPVTSTAQRTPRLHFTGTSRTASSIGILGRPRRAMGLHDAPRKGRQNAKAGQAGRDDGESKTGATPSTTRTLSARQKPQTAAASAVTAASGRRGNPAASRFGSCGSPRGPRIAGSGGGSFTRCSGANSASLDTTITASIVPTKEADDEAPTSATESNIHGTTRADTGTTMSGSHPSNHALDGGELVEPFSGVFVVASPAAAAAATTPSPSTTMQKSARDSGAQRGRLRDSKASSSRDPDKDHDAHDASLSSPPQHRHRRHAGAEGETPVSVRLAHKASARHAPVLPENEARHPDGGAAPGTTGLEGADSRALLRRLAQQKNRTRAMEERLRFGVNCTTSVNPNSGSHSARSGGGSGFVWSDGHITGRWGLESESCTPTRGAARACMATDLARQDFSTLPNTYSVSAATGDATLDTPVTRASTARHGGSAAADALHVTVVDPAEATTVCVHAAHSGAGAAAAAQQTSSNPRRRRVDLRARLASRLTAVSSSLSASPAKRRKGCTTAVTAPVSATAAATAASAQNFRRAESAYSIRSRSPTYISIMHHAGYGDRRRHSIGGDVMPPTTLTMPERQLRSSRAPVASQLIDWVQGGE